MGFDFVDKAKVPERKRIIIIFLQVSRKRTIRASIINR